MAWQALTHFASMVEEREITVPDILCKAFGADFGSELESAISMSIGLGGSSDTQTVAASEGRGRASWRHQSGCFERQRSRYQHPREATLARESVPTEPSLPPTSSSLSPAHFCRQRQRQGAYVDCRPKARGFTRTGRRSVRQRGTCGRCPLVRWCIARCIARCELHCLLRSALHERSACVVGAVEELAWRE